MTQFTDDMLVGLYCQTCGVFLEEAVGFPRMCWECEEDFPDQAADLKATMTPQQSKRRARRQRRMEEWVKRKKAGS